jgi:hypothetical protein
MSCRMMRNRVFTYNFHVRAIFARADSKRKGGARK